MKAFFFTVCLIWGFCAAGDWPGFRGTGDSHTDIKDLPEKWSETESIAWRKKLIGEGQSSPVISGEKVFVTSIGGDQKEKLFLEAFSTIDGELLWKKEFDATQKVAEVSDMISRGTPTPVADENGVYVFFESGDLFGLDLDGNTKWERRIVTEFGEFIGNHGVGTSLVNSPESVVLSIDHSGPSYILSIDKKTGKTIWKTERTSRVSWSTPLYLEHDGKALIIVSSNGSVDGYDSKTGEQIWTVTGVKNNTVASPTPAGDMIVIGSSNPGDCMAIKLGGKGDITDTHIAWRADSVTSSFGSPLVHQDIVYFVNRAGVLQAVKIEDGSLLWQERLPGSTWASSLGVGDKVYSFCKEGNTAVFSPTADGPGEMEVSSLPVAEKDRIYGFAIAPGKIILRTGRELICIGK